jgi:DNA-binding transcriptional LysR family regulator
MKRIADLSVFVSVVKAGSLSEASNDLGLSVASISKYISRIEQELGVRVLVRNARGLRLTSEGQALYVRVDTLLSQLNKAIAYVSACRDVPRGMLKVSSTIGLGRNRIAPLVSEFSKLYPDVTVQLSLGDRYVDMVLDDVDVAISIGAPDDASLVAKRLMSNPCCVCASPA